MNFESIKQSEGNQLQKTIYCIIPFIWNVYNKQIYIETLVVALGKRVCGEPGATAT